MKEEIFNGHNNYDLAGYVWDDVKNPIGVVQIIHGMQEHAIRYASFAQFLNKEGYIVVATDLRAHGKTAGDIKLLGHTNGDVFKEIVLDQVIISEKLKKQYELPLFIFGHSFGSFIAQRYIQVCTLSSKAVICGSAYSNTILNRLGKLVADLTALFKGNHAEAKLVEKLSFGSYAKKFPNGNWLSSNEEEFIKYKNDPYCGTPFPACFYRSMLKNIIKNYRDLNMITPEQKVYLISGANDPVGNNGKLVTKLFEVYKKHHVNVKMKLYPNCRHELINETNNDEVFVDVLNFFNN